MDKQTQEYRLSQIERVQEDIKKPYKAKIVLHSGNGKKTFFMNISYNEFCSVKNILTIS